MHYIFPPLWRLNCYPARHCNITPIGGLFKEETTRKSLIIKYLTYYAERMLDTIKEYVVDRCELPDNFHISEYEFFQGIPTRILHGNERINLGGRTVEILHTPGHAPGHMCFWEEKKSYLFTGDLVYKGTLTAWFPSTDPEAYLESLETVAELSAKRIFPAHHSLDIQPEILLRMRKAFRELKETGKLHHGCGIFDYGDWSVWL